MSQTNQLPISSPLSLGDLLDRAFRLYRARFGLFLLTAAIFQVPLGIISGLFTGNFMIGYMDMMENIAQNPGEQPEVVMNEMLFPLIGYAGGVMLVSIIWLILNGIVSLALTSQSIATLHQEEQTLAQSLRTGWNRFWTYLLMNVLRFLGIGVTTIGVLLAMMFIGVVIAFVVGPFLGDGPNFSGGSGGLGEAAGMIGFMILFCCIYILAIAIFLGPILYLAARWIVATPGIVEQKWKAGESLRESWLLTRDYAWRCIGYLVLLSLLSFLIISLPQIIFQQLLTMLLPTEFAELVFTLSTVLGSLFNVVWQPFYIAAVVLLYYDLRVRKESYDLELQLQQLESEVEQPQL